jgi:hypothetical protein
LPALCRSIEPQTKRGAEELHRGYFPSFSTLGNGRELFRRGRQDPQRFGRGDRSTDYFAGLDISMEDRSQMPSDPVQAVPDRQFRANSGHCPTLTFAMD